MNIKNSDAQCFKYSILAALYPHLETREEVGSYSELDYFKRVNFADLSYPTPITECQKFMNRNEEISVNVYRVEDKLIFPLFAETPSQAVTSMEPTTPTS